jgi:hypothetical protein
MGNVCERTSLDYNVVNSEKQPNAVANPSKTIVPRPVQIPSKVIVAKPIHNPMHNQNKKTVEAIVNQVYTVLKTNVYTNVKGQTSTPFVEELKDNEKVYAIGDLEGQIDLLYGFFIHNNLIQYTEGKGIEWIGDNVYVVQCGDQIDRNHRPNQDTDLAVILFMEFLYYISNGRVISVLGNHELWNIDVLNNNQLTNVDKMDMEYTYKHEGYTRKMSRTDILNTTLFRNILLNRYIAYKIDKLMFSHAGILQKDISSITDFNSIGDSTTAGINMACLQEITNSSTECLNKKCKICLSLWHRFFAPFEPRKFKANQIPINFISITGHNNLNTVSSIKPANMMIYAHHQRLQRTNNIVPIHMFRDDMHYDIEYNSTNSANPYSIASNANNQDGYTVLHNVDNNNGYLVIIDVNSFHNPYDTSDYNKFKFLEINKKQDDIFNLKQHTVNVTNNQLFNICYYNYANIFRVAIIPELYKYEKHIKKTGGNYKKLKRTDEKTKVQGKMRVVYKQGNTKYVMWNKEYVKLSTLHKRKAF